MARRRGDKPDMAGSQRRQLLLPSSSTRTAAWPWMFQDGRPRRAPISINGARMEALTIVVSSPWSVGQFPHCASDGYTSWAVAADVSSATAEAIAKSRKRFMKLLLRVTDLAPVRVPQRSPAVRKPCRKVRSKYLDKVCPCACSTPGAAWAVAVPCRVERHGRAEAGWSGSVSSLVEGD